MALSYDPFDPAIVADPYPVYAWLRDDEPAYHAAATDTFVLSRYDDVVAALGNTDLLSSDAMRGVLMGQPTGKGEARGTGRTPFMAEFAQQLLTAHPKEAARVFAPLVSLFEGVLEEATAAGTVRAGLRRGPIAGAVLEAIMFNTFSSTIAGVPVRSADEGPAEELWDLLLHGMAPPCTS